MSPTRDRGARAASSGIVEHVGAVGGERELEQRAGEARARLDEREEAARREVDALQRAAQQADDLAHEPVVLVRQQRRVHGEHRRGIALGLQQPGADLGLVDAQPQERVVELARTRAAATSAAPAASIAAMPVGCAPVGACTVKVGGALRAVDRRRVTCV